MAYTEENIQSLMKCINEIENRKEHTYAAATYKDIPALQEMDRIVMSQLALENPRDQHTLADSIFVVRYLAKAYETMWRVAVAVKYYNLLLQLQRELYDCFDEKDEECRDDYYSALRARNYYQKDSCTDLAELVKGMLPDQVCQDIEKQVLVDWKPLKHDPVELTEQYLAVIDEVERRMDTKEVQKMHHFYRSELLQKLLREYGIEWKSMIELNPNMHFD